MFTPMQMVDGLVVPEPTPSRLEDLLEEMDLTNDMAAHYGGTTRQTIVRWLTGAAPIHRGVFNLFVLLAWLRRGRTSTMVSWSTPGGAGDAGA